jgi:hypothetical protein
MGVAVVMSRPTDPVQPGGEATTEVRLRNTGAIVDQFELDLVGEAASWAHVEPATVNLLPGEEATARIVFQPPRSSRVREGPAAYALRVMSREDTAGSSVQEAVVEVAPFSEVVGEMLPRTSTGRRSGRHQVALDNLGNHPELVTIAASDPDLKLDFRIEPVNLTLEPGTATFVKVRAKPKRTFWRGPNTTVPFDVVATPAGAEPVRMPGAMLQQSLLPSWFFKALALAAVACVALAVLWFTVFRPAVKSTAQAVVKSETAQLAKDLQKASKQADTAQNQSEQAEQSAEVANKNSKDAEKTANKNDDRLDEAIGPDGPGLNEGGPKAPASGTMDAKDARDFRVTTDDGVAPGAGFVNLDPVRPPAKKVLWVSDVVLQNPAGDSGTLRIQRGDNVLLVFGLENFRDLDYHFIQPAKFTTDDPLQVAVRCTNAKAGAANPSTVNTGPCTPSVYFSGQVLPPTQKATNTQRPASDQKKNA